MADASQTSHIEKEQGLDRKRLKIVKQGFLKVNQGRLARALDSLSERQRLFINSLPLFFHTNHPMLPGFISRSAPKGVANFSPSADDIKQAQQFANSFTYQKRGDEALDIEALFLMGSSGTIAQSRRSDFDVWVCHRSDLNSAQKYELEQSCNKLTAYAESIQLEVNFFLMNGEQFRQGNSGKLSIEDCGSAQHVLLLDEFYRTALLLAGKMPIWWLIPPDSQEPYSQLSQQLISKRYIPNNITLDFGNVEYIPVGEFIGAGIWQLYKGIGNPYKSVLKLACIQAYASEHPNTVSLSELYKQAIYQDQLDLDELDPYVMLYRKLEQHFVSRNELERLELIRRCLYLKAGVKLSRYHTSNDKTPPSNWRVQALLKLIQEWGWSKNTLEQLDERDNWKIEHVSLERNALVSALMSSYRFLSHFAKTHNQDTSSSTIQSTKSSDQSTHISKQELAILGRKLYAAFERRAGKIEKLNLGISQKVSESIVHFKEQESDTDKPNLWHLYDGIANNDALIPAVPIKQSIHLLNLFAWAFVNGVITNQTQIHISSKTLHMNADELYQLRKNLHKFLNPQSLSLDHCGNAFNHAAKPKIKLFIMNAGLAPMPQLEEQGIQRLSSHADAFCYSGLKENLVRSIDIIEINTWHEVTTTHFSGENSIIDCLQHHLQSIPPDRVLPPQTQVLCFCPSHANTIAQRMNDLLQQVKNGIYLDNSGKHARFIFSIKDTFAMVQYQGGGTSLKKVAGSKNELMDVLAAPQHEFNPIIIDSNCNKISVLNEITRLNRANEIQIFIIEDEKNQVQTLYVVDEYGSVYRYQTQHNDIHSAIKPLNAFLQTCQIRQQNQKRLELDSYSDIALFVMQLSNQKSHLTDCVAKPYKISDLDTSLPVLSIQAIAERDTNGHILFNLYCDYQEFSALEYGEDVYQKAAQYILSKRTNQSRYPCYITDLDLSQAIAPEAGSHIQTVQYLEYKQTIESRLNQTMQELKHH